jgi:hypothetical protein
MNFRVLQFFHADTGKGLGASHQTGWTGLVAWMIFQTGSTARLPRTPRTPRSSADHYFAESVPATPVESEHSHDEANDGAGSRTTTEVMGAELSPDEVSYSSLNETAPASAFAGVLVFCVLPVSCEQLANHLDSFFRT